MKEPADWARVRALFHGALELRPRSVRRSCGARPTATTTPVVRSNRSSPRIHTPRDS